MSKKPINPWRNWYHCMGNSKSTWLPGDPRGFRTRHHDEHVEGEYKSPPPPGRYEQQQQHRRMQQKLKNPPVHLAPHQRHIVCIAMAERLLELEVEARLSCHMCN